MNENEQVNVNEQLLAELQSFSKKQVRWQRVSALCFMGLLTAVIVVLCIMVPRVSKTLEHINSVAARVETSLDGVDTMVSEMTTASKNLNKLVDENSGELTSAVEKMANVDYDGLNQAIQDLQDAVGPMANFFNKFR